MQGWGGSCRGGVGWVMQGGVCHVGVVWGRVGCVTQGWGVLCRGGVGHAGGGRGWLMQGWAGWCG